MTGNNRHDPSAGRATGDAAMRGALLVGVAVLIGALLLWRGHDDGDAIAQETTGNAPAATTTSAAPAASGATAGTGKTGAATGATGAATGPTATTVLRKPAEVKVIVANGTGSANGAGNVTTRLQPKGYAMLPAADYSSSTVAVSKIWYRDGYAEEAKQVARDAQAVEPVEALLERMPDEVAMKTAASTTNAKTAHVVVLIGLDKKIPS
jgi:hypothetical protein